MSGGPRIRVLNSQRVLNGIVKHNSLAINISFKSHDTKYNPSSTLMELMFDDAVRGESENKIKESQGFGCFIILV
jgi:hypothetical protein